MIHLNCDWRIKNLFEWKIIENELLECEKYNVAKIACRLIERKKTRGMH